MDSTRSTPLAQPMSKSTTDYRSGTARSQSQQSQFLLQPTEHAPTHQERRLDRAISGAHRPSPLKAPRGSNNSLLKRAELGFVPITAPVPPAFTTDSPTKKTPRNEYAQTSQLSGMPQSALFTTFPSVNPDKQSFREKRQLNETSNDNFADFPEPSLSSKSLKRTLMEAAPLKERSAKKQKRENIDYTHLPDPQDLPPIEDDGSKPPYSYATLIGMSILRAPNRRLTLAQIYKWISDTFSYYKNSDPGWQNSIRHNLSLNKAFIKQERPKDDPGKGNYWAIESGMEAQFLKDKPLRRATMSSLPLPIACPREPAHVQNSGTTTWVVPPASHTNTSKTSKNVDLSSDATIPASDPALQDDTGDEGPNPAVSQAPPRSSPPQPIHSSPPIVPPRFTRQATPPTPSHPVTSSAIPPRSRKRESTAVNDSGYFSSLESSAMRPHKAGHILTSDLDIDPPRIKRGRAEEEIARIRSSSHDISPRRSAVLKDAVVALGSSPVRSEYVSMLPPPLTPVIKFKKPAKPPPSVSPNTNLRNHRKKIQQMVNSPIKHLGLTDEDLPWSPAFRIQDETYTPTDNLHTTFDVFTETAEEAISTTAYGSPEKRSLKRARTHTGISAGTVLADITTMSVNSRPSMSSLPPTRSKGLLFPESPSKVPGSTHPVDPTQDDFFSFHLFDDSSGEVDGVDLLQGFQKIGGASKEEPTGSKSHTSRPQLNIRSNTTLF